MNFLWTSGGWVMFSNSQSDNLFPFFQISFRFNLIFYKVPYSTFIVLFFFFCLSTLFCFSFGPTFVACFCLYEFFRYYLFTIQIFIFTYTQRFAVSVALPSFSNFQVTLLYFSLYTKLYSLVFLLEQSQWKKIFLVFLLSVLH